MYVLFHFRGKVIPLFLFPERQEAVSEKRKGIQKNTFGNQIGQFPVDVEALSPEFQQFLTVGKVKKGGVIVFSTILDIVRKRRLRMRAVVSAGVALSALMMMLL